VWDAMDNFVRFVRGLVVRHMVRYVYVTLFAIVVLGFLLRWPLVTYNLPVTSRVDERTGLGILYRFEQGSLNPEFFDWPTFYYYLTYSVTRPFIDDFQEIIWYGRVVNLLLGCFLIVVVFLLARSSLGADEIGLIAALLVASSPILIGNGSYIGTDILLTLLSLLALLFFTLFFKNLGRRYWFAGILVTGLAVSTKYTAALVVVTYLLCEFFFLRRSAGLSNHWLERPFSPWWLSVGALVGGMLCLAFRFFFPLQFILSWVERQGSINFVLDPRELEFIKSLWSKPLILGILLVAVFFLSLRFKTFFSRFCYPRPYWGLALISLVFVLGSPFCLISWKRFLYDFCTVLKQNALASDQRQYVHLLKLYLTSESTIALIFFTAGVYWLVKRKGFFTVPAIYLVIYYVYHGAATRSFVRYWTPILPVVFIISACGIYFTASLFRRSKWGHKAFVLVALMLVGLEISSNYSSTHYIAQMSEPDNMYASYYWVLDKEPSRIFYAGYIPDVELGIRGFDLQMIPTHWITTGGRTLLQKMRPDDVLMIDERLEAQMSATLRQNLILEWSSDKEGHSNSQYIFRRQSSD